MALAVGGLLASPATAGFQILFGVDCPPDGIIQQDTVKVDIPSKADGYKATLESPRGTPVGAGPICPGTVMTQDITRDDKPGDPKKDVITNVITTNNMAGGGMEEARQAFFKAQYHVDLGVTKDGPDTTVRESRSFVWTVTVTNHSEFPVKAGDAKVVDHLPRGYRYQEIVNVPDKAVKFKPQTGDSGPRLTYTLHEDLPPGKSIELLIRGKQRVADAGQSVTNDVEVMHLNKAVTEPTPDGHQNSAFHTIFVSGD